MRTRACARAHGHFKTNQSLTQQVQNPHKSCSLSHTEKYGGRIYENTRLRKADSSRKALTTLEGATVRAKQGYVLATASPVTSSILDSALHVLALHGKQHVRRRCAGRGGLLNLKPL
jgi:hypothetical protein